MTKPVTRRMAVDCLLWCLTDENKVWCEVDQNDGELMVRYYLRCYICGEPLLPEQDIQFDHIHADVHGGPHEYQNLRPVHYDPCHKKKTKKDIQANAKVKRLRGETKQKPKRNWPKRKMNQSVR